MDQPQPDQKSRLTFEIGSAPLDQVRHLLRGVFPRSPKFQDDGAFLDWLYLRNPDGQAAWRDAIVDGQSLAHYGAIPQLYHSASGQERLYLSVHSATHADYRGRGTFAALGEAVYELERERFPETAGAIGVPNREAAPPRSKRLGWTLFETLPLKVSIGAPVAFNKAISGLSKDLIPDPAIIPDEMFSPRHGWRQRWNREKLLWRASNPLETIWLHRLGPIAALVTVRKRAGFPVIAVVVKTLTLPSSEPLDMGPLTAAIRAKHGVMAVAHMGRNADIRMPGFDFPERWRPSPLFLGGRAFHQPAFDYREIDCFEAWDYDVF
jgi:hypothetical protein